VSRQKMLAPRRLVGTRSSCRSASSVKTSRSASNSNYAGRVEGIGGADATRLEGALLELEVEGLDGEIKDDERLSMIVCN
jgi:hypothetical protein